MPSEDVELVSRADVEKYAEGGQVGNVIVDWATLHSISAGQMSDANDAIYALMEANPEYEFLAQDVFQGVRISWRRTPDGDRKDRAASSRIISSRQS